MRNRNDLSQKSKIALRLICLMLCFVLSISSLSACKKKDTVDNNSSVSSSENVISDDVSSEDVESEEESSEEEYSSSEDFTDDFQDDFISEEVEPDFDFDFEEEPTILKVYNSKEPVNNNYMGMNSTVWHAYGFMGDSGRKYTQEMLDIEMNRLEQMNFTTFRTNFYPSWLWENGKGYNFNATRMNQFIDYCLALQERGWNVMYNQMWYMEMVGNASKSGSTGYLNGFGDDLYGEQAEYSDCIATEFKLTGDETPVEAGMGDTRPGANPTFAENTVTDYFNRLAVSALRYGVFISNVLKTAQAKGVNNIDYILYFTEPSYYFMTPDDPKGPSEQEYIFICRTIRNVLEKAGCAKGIKHVGPNQGHIVRGDGLLQYVIEKDPDLFDILTSHFYPTANDASNDSYYDYTYDALNNYRTTMEKAGLWGKKEFWQDEMAAKQEGALKRNWQMPIIGTQTIVSAICSQQMGVDNILYWQVFDQAWLDTRQNADEFTDGIHICGTAPSLYVSATPYPTYYTIGLFTRYNNSTGGKAIATSSGDYEDYPGLYIGATELPDGNVTITVASVNLFDTKFEIQFDKVLGKDLHRHVEDTINRVPKTSARLSDADCSWKDVQTTLTDTIAPYAVHVYTTCKY